MGLIEETADHLLELGTDVTCASIEREQLDRIEHELKVAISGIDIGGRLAASSASRVERAIDRKRWRRVAHALATCWTQWNICTSAKRKTPINGERQEEHRLEAVKRDWDVWHQDQVHQIAQAMRLVATYAYKEGKRTWGNAALNRLRNELETLEYAMRAEA